MFGDSKQNSKYAQLIFTTHDVTIPENDAINRDQVWLIEKGRDHAASLYSFSEFKTRYGTNFKRAICKVVMDQDQQFCDRMQTNAKNVFK